jgi:sporulation protein YlmC with PRC-barrel domain
MRNRNLITGLVAGGLALATANLARGEDPDKNQHQNANQQRDQQSQTAGERRHDYNQNNQKKTHSLQAGNEHNNSGITLRASTVIGMPVRSESGEKLGKVQNLVVNLESQSVPYAIVEYGGALGIGGRHVAIPLNELKWSGDARQFTIAATRDQFESAATEPTDAWVGLAGEDWRGHIDRFYGRPENMNRDRFERQETMRGLEGREPVRNPADGTTRSAVPQYNGNTPNSGTWNSPGVTGDKALMNKVNEVVRQQAGDRAGDINVSIKNGVVTLKGKVGTEAQKQAIESQIKGLPGVERVEYRDNSTASE